MPETYDLIVRGGEVVNHAGRGLADVGVRGGKIAAVGDLAQASAGEVFDATGLTVLPGVIDTQVHFREPGLEWKEDLETGSRARGAGRRRRRCSRCPTPSRPPPTPTRWPTSSPAPRAACTATTPSTSAAPTRTPRFLGELERLPGCCGVKVFMGASTGTLLVQDDEGVEQVLRHINRRAAFHSEDEYRLAERRPLARTGDWTSHSEVRDAQSAIQSTERLVRHRHGAGQAHPRPARDHRRGDRLPGRPQGRGQRRADAAAPDPGRPGGLRAAEGLRPDEPADPRRRAPAPACGAGIARWASPTCWAPTTRRTPARRRPGPIRPRRRACRACRPCCR